MFQRYLKDPILEMFSHFLVTYLAGPRQVGKSTLVKEILGQKRDYFTMDNLQTLQSAKNNPQEFVRMCTNPCTIDEIQRCCELLLPIKEYVDAHKKKGHFMLTGSADILALPHVADSLAGRMALFELLPLSVQEIIGVKKNWITDIFLNPTIDVFTSPSSITYSDLCSLIISGGYPDVSQSTSKKFQSVWFESYTKTMIERDLREINDYKSITRTHRLFQLLALRSSTIINMADLSRSCDIPVSSLSLYLDAIESLFLIKRIPGYYSNLNNRLTKAPKLILVDSGLMAYHVDIYSTKNPWEHREWGQVFETFVINEIRKQISWQDSPIGLYHYRTQRGHEIDLVLENKRKEIIAIEIKASRNVTSDMKKNFSQIKIDAGENFKIGLVLYSGDSIQILDKDVYAIPLKYIC